MTRGLVTLVALLLVTSTSLPAAARARAAEQRLQVVFIADGAGPMAFVEVSERGDGQRIARAASWAFLAGDASVSGAVSDQVRGARSAPPLVDLPAAPPGLGLTGDVDGTLVLTLDGLGDWQTALASSPPAAARVGPAVSSTSSARLLVEPPPTTLATGRYTTRAVLYGTRGAYEGVAVVDMRAGARRGGALVLRGSDGVSVEPFGREQRASERSFVADRASACERPVPTALLLWPDGSAPARMVASAAPACVPGDRAIVPLEGARLEPRRDTPLRGLLVDEPLGAEARAGARAPTPRSDRAAFLLGAN